MLGREHNMGKGLDNERSGVWVASIVMGLEQRMQSVSDQK
jgi:hypothetical protein